MRRSESLVSLACLQLSAAQRQAEKATADAAGLQAALDASVAENKALASASGMYGLGFPDMFSRPEAHRPFVFRSTTRDCQQRARRVATASCIGR